MRFRSPPKHWKFILLLAVFSLGVLAMQAALPVMEGNDETIHFNYLTVLRTTGRLPDRATYATNPARQESGQPPLYYWVTVKVFDLLNLPRHTTDLWADLADNRNQWFTPPNWWNQKDNFNQYYHGEGERAFGHPDVVLLDLVGRLISLAFGVLAVIGAYNLACEIFAQEGWALTATAIFAFTPQMLYMCAMLSNDASATAFATLALWQTVALLKRGASPWRLIAVGVFTALAGLSKVSAMLILPGIVIAILFDAVNRRVPIARLVGNLALFGAMIGLIFGPWVAFGVASFNDPFGLKTHADVSRDLLPKPSVLQVLGELPNTYFSYWAKFGSSSIWLTPVVYVLLTAIIGLALWGYWRYWRRNKFNGLSWSSLAVQQAIVFAVIAVLAVAALLYWLVTLFPIAFAITGRLVYFAHGVFAVFITGGLYLLVQCREQKVGKWVRAYSVGAIMASGLVLAPLTVWNAFTGPRLLSKDQLPALKGSQVEFDHTVRFLGYAGDPVIHENSLYTVSLCWEVLQETQRNGAFSIKIFGEVGDELGGRTSVHGMGHFNSPLWKPGDIFCDNVDIPVKGPLKPGQVDNVILIMFDARDINASWQATALDGTPIKYPLIYQAISAAGDMTTRTEYAKIQWQPTNISFSGLADLKGYSVDGALMPGGTVQLNLLWEVKGRTTENLSEFVHLTGASTGLSLGDSAPRNGLYPTWAWSPGEKIVDSWKVTLPGDLQPGKYGIQVGFARQSDGQRLAAVQDGKGAIDNSPTVLTFEIR
jgi:4-amino-4-deoxy-L-arabinose transferase-like glycosyltransferase